MQIKFLNIYNYYDTEPAQVQYELLGFWQQSIADDLVPFIHKARIEFVDYSLMAYPDQVKARREISNACCSSKRKKHDGSSWDVRWTWDGKEYNDLDILYNDLAEKHHLMELVITLEDE